MQRQLFLALAVKSIDGTLGPEGIVPSALVFEDFTSLRSLCGPVVPRSSPSERAEAAQQSRRYTSQHLVKVKFKRAVHHNITPASDRVYQPGDEVLLWREKQVEIRMREWISPYTVVRTDSCVKIVVVQKEAGSALERFNTTQVKLFLRPEDAAVGVFNIFNRAFSTYATESATLMYPHTPLVEFIRSPESDEIDTLKREGKHALAAINSNFNIPATTIQVTEVVDKDHPRASSPEMKGAIKEEVRDLMQRGTFKLMLKEELPEGAKVLNCSLRASD